MNEIVYLSKQEGIISVATIHQPSGKVFRSFDQLMILSKGRMAFAGSVDEAQAYFERIGYPCPSNTNPAGKYILLYRVQLFHFSSGFQILTKIDTSTNLLHTEHFLDLVNADFYDDETVNNVLDVWSIQSSDWQDVDCGQVYYDVDEYKDKTERPPFNKGLAILLRRHFLLVVRDPLLYLGRCIFFLLANLIFAFGYWNAREFTQDQAFSKVWASMWFVGGKSNCVLIGVIFVPL